jgi:hypothetical protein
MNSKVSGITIVIVALVVVIVGILLWQKNLMPANTEPVAASYRDATYEIEGKSITLTNGISEIEAAPGSASKIITRYFGNEAAHDLNGDGTEDIAFLLTQNGGGSGTFYYAVAALKTADGYRGTNAILLGDRIAPQTTEFRDGEIIVNYADRAPGEPMSARPSVGISEYFTIADSRLVEVSKGDQTVCTLEAKLCPDGSYVGRSGPKCEFVPCPGTGPPQGESGISGIVLLGPTCPVMRDPPDPQCADKPFATHLVITTPDGAGVIKEFSSDADGKFKVNIPAGDYVVRSTADTNILPRCASNGTVTVGARTYIDVTIYCDTGIR